MFVILLSMSQVNSSSSVGGAGAEAGVSYEDRVGTWIEVEILSEGHGFTKFDLGPGHYFSTISRQRGIVPDDILIQTALGGKIYCQATTSVKCTATNPKLRDTFSQFLTRFLTDRETLNTEKDRLALITISKRQQTITDDLRGALKKVRKLTSDQSLSDLRLTSGEEKALDVVREITKSLWNEQTSSKPTDLELKEFLGFVTVVKVEVERGESEHVSALDSLAKYILVKGERAENAWSDLLEISSEMGKSRSGMDRKQLREALQKRGYELQSTPSYRKDIDRLKEITASTCKRLRRFSHIELADGATIQIKRKYPDILMSKSLNDRKHILVVGEPGAGKSGVLSGFLKRLTDEKYDFLALSAGSLAVNDYEHLKSNLGLEHNIETILENWSDASIGFVVIDALDSVRDDRTINTLFECMRRIAELKTLKWRVIASVREYDLRRFIKGGPVNLFAGEPISGEHSKEEFMTYSHLYVELLDDNEIQQIVEQNPKFYSIIKKADSLLTTLLRNPFNLSLLGTLINLPETELLGIRSQIELLDRYWDRRVLGGIAGQQREYALEVLSENVVSQKDLWVNRRALVSIKVAFDDITELLSRKVIIDHGDDNSLLAFSHHVLNDYAIARTLLRGQKEKLINRLSQYPDEVLMLYPSLQLHFAHLWSINTESTQVFWDTVFALIGDNNIPSIVKLVGPSIAAWEGRKVEEFEPLILALHSEDSEVKANAITAFKHLVIALIEAGESGDRRKPVFTGPDAGPWLDLLGEMINYLDGTSSHWFRILFDRIMREKND